MGALLARKTAFEQGQTERERRFLVLADHGQLPSLEGCRQQSLWQGYLKPDLMSGLMPVRLRIVEGEDTATLTRKTGSGESRVEYTQRISASEAKRLRSFMSDGLSKVRYWWHRDEEYEISLDFYRQNFDGLVVIELEWRSEECPALPTWIVDLLAHGAVVEVTENWSNVDLACLQPWVDRANKDRLLELLQLPAVPVIGCEGGPASGKDGFLNLMARDFGSVVEIVPEAATMVINGGYVPSPNDEMMWMKFEQTIIESQAGFESWRQWVARIRGCKVMLTNRTLSGLAGYLPNGFLDLKAITGLDAAQVGKRYDRILLFGMPDEEIYAKHHAENPSRYEQNYAEARGVDTKIRIALSSHPAVVEIPAFPDGQWLGKVEFALERIREIVPQI